MRELTAALADVYFLRDQPEALRAEIAKLAACRKYPRGNILFHHGDPGSMLYIVVDGQVKVSVISEDGREVVVALMRPSGVCGLISALDGGANVGTAMTVSECYLAAIPADRFLGWLRGHPALHESLLLGMAQMIRAAYEKVGEQALLPVKKRLLFTLVDIARKEGQTSGSDIVFIRPTHQELADRIGTTRVVVCRALKELLEEEGIIHATGGRSLRVRLTAVQEAAPYSVT